jgi:hypothetical protein
LCHNFHALLLEKCISYQKNRSQKRQCVPPSEVEEEEEAEEEREEDDLYAVSNDEVNLSECTPAASSNAPTPTCMDFGPARSSEHDTEQQAGPSPSISGNPAPVAHMVPIQDRAPLAHYSREDDKDIEEAYTSDQAPRLSSNRATYLAESAEKANQACSTMFAHVKSSGCGSPGPAKHMVKSPASPTRKRTNPAVPESDGSFGSETSKKRVSHIRTALTKVVKLRLTPDKLRTLAPAVGQITDDGTPKLYPAAPPRVMRVSVTTEKQQSEVRQPNIVNEVSTANAALNPVSAQHHQKDTNIWNTATANSSTTLSDETARTDPQRTLAPSDRAVRCVSDNSQGQHQAKHNSIQEQSAAQSANSEPQSNGESSRASSAGLPSITVNYEKTVLKSGLPGIAAVTLRFDPGINIAEKSGSTVSMYLAKRFIEQHLDKLTAQVSVVNCNECRKEFAPEPQAVPQEASSGTKEQTAEVSMPPGTRKGRDLAIQLRTTGHSSQQFVIVSIETSVEDLFLKIQQRMNRRLDSKEIQLLTLHLPGQADESNAYGVERNDPDTWEMFMDLLKGQRKDGEKVRVDADVEV